MDDDSGRANALRHAERIRIDGLDAERQQLLQRLAKTADINDALEIRHRLDKIDLTIVEALAVRNHLEAATTVQPPSATMIEALESLLKALAGFKWQTEQVVALVDFARQTTREFGAELEKTRQLGG